MLAYEGESTPEISANVMMNAANAVDTGLITFAARDSESVSYTHLDVYKRQTSPSTFPAQAAL